MVVQHGIAKLSLGSCVAPKEKDSVLPGTE
jgi:hypothetical protein